MNKKTITTIIIVVVAVVIVGVAYNGYNRYRQGKIVKEYLKSVGMPAEYYNAVMQATGGKFSEEAIKEIAKQGGGGGGFAGLIPQLGGGAGSVTEEPVKEETPEQKFGKFKEVSLPGDQLIRSVDADIKNSLKATFLDVKLSSYMTNYYGSGGAGLVYMTQKKISSADANQFSTDLEKSGFKVIASGGGESSSVTAEKGNNIYSFSFSSDSQEVTAIIMQGASGE